MVALSPDVIWFVRVAMLGDLTAPTAANKQYRFATQKPAWDVDDLYISCLDAFPSESSWRVRWRDAKSEVGTNKILMRYSASLGSQFLRTDWDAVAELVTPLPYARPGATDTINILHLTGGAGSLVGLELVIGREAISVDVFNGGLSYDITRGVLNTPTDAHDPDDDPQMFLASEGVRLKGHRVDLYKVPLDAPGYASEELFWPGVLRDIDAPNPELIELSLDLLIDWVARRRLLEDRWVGERLRGSQAYRNKPDDRITAPRSAALGGSKPLISVDGESAVLATASKEGPVTTVVVNPEFSTLFPGSKPVPAPEDLPDRAFEYFSTNDAAPSDDASPGTSTLPLSSNAINLTLQLMTTTGHGSNFPSGGTNYDVGYPELGLGVPFNWVNFDAFERLRARLGTLAEIPDLSLGRDTTDPIEGLSWIRQHVLRPLGIVLGHGLGGLFEPFLFGDAPGLDTDTIKTIAQSDFLDADFTWVKHGTEVLDTIQFEFADRPGVGPQSTNARDVYASQRYALGLLKEETLKMHGQPSVFEAFRIAQRWLMRWRKPIPILTANIKPIRVLWPGELVKVTHALLPAKDGSHNQVDQVYLVTGRRYSIDDHRATYELWDVGRLYKRQGVVGPSATVISYDAGPPETVIIEQNDYVSSENDRYTKDVDAWQDLFDLTTHTSFAVLLYDSNLTLRNTATLSAVDTVNDELEFSTLPTTPNAGDILVLQPYDLAKIQSNEGLFDYYAYMAASDGKLDSTDDGYDWVW